MIHYLFLGLNWLGSEWVLGILGVLSVVVIAVIINRTVAIRNLRKSSERIWAERIDAWFVHPDTFDWRSDIETLRSQYPALETEVLALIQKSEGSADRSELESRISTYLDQRRLKLERNISILGTIGSNAPFIGLLGTVLGIIRAFHNMGNSGALGSGMDSIASGISEALVATAIGLFVAIPAVVAFNYLNKGLNQILKRAHCAGLWAIQTRNSK